MRYLQRILGISWSEMIEDKITNKNVRENFKNIKKAKSSIAKRMLIYLGKVITTPCQIDIYLLYHDLTPMET